MSEAPEVEVETPTYVAAGVEPRVAAADQPAVAPYPIVVGVTGHRDIAPAAVPAVRTAVRNMLDDLRQEFGSALCILTGLADGADQLVAEAAVARSIAVIAVAPMPRSIYRTKLRDGETFERLWRRAALTLELPEVSGASDHDDLQYEQFGALLSRRCHLLVALWDGCDSAERGGTAAVVHMRQQGEHIAAGFRNGPLFADAAWRLDLVPAGPILHILTPRPMSGAAMQAEGQKTVEADDCVLLPGANADDDIGPLRVAQGKICETLHATATGDDFAKIAKLNHLINRFRCPDRRVFERQLADLGLDQYDADLSFAPLMRLGRWQAAADAAAQFYQRRLLGQFVPARSATEMLKNGWDAITFLRRRPRFGVLFGFAAAVPAAVLAFELYAHLWRSPWALGSYLAIFLAVVLAYYLYVEPRELQNRFQDYRALAEALRVQLFWAAARVPAAASDHYLRLQSGELGWIQLALRGPALWALAAALAADKPLRRLVMTRWIEHQLSFFGLPSSENGKAWLHGHAAARGRRWARCFLFAGFTIGVILAVAEARGVIPGTWLLPEEFWRRLGRMREWLLVAAATAPAIATSFIVSVDLRSYEAHGHSYATMSRLFSRAAQATEAADDAEFQEIVRDLGREALAENATWLLDHRRRPIKHQ